MDWQSSAAETGDESDKRAAVAKANFIVIVEVKFNFLFFLRILIGNGGTEYINFDKYKYFF